MPALTGYLSRMSLTQAQRYLSVTAPSRPSARDALPPHTPYLATRLPLAFAWYDARRT